MRDTFDKIKFWIKEKILWPVQNWYINHFNWIPMEAQVFKDGNLVYVQWNGDYNRKTSIIDKKRNKSLYRKLRWVDHGSVIKCEYIWGIDGFLRNVRMVKCISSRKEILLMNFNFMPKPEYMRGEPSYYFKQLEIFDGVHSI